MNDTHSNPSDPPSLMTDNSESPAGSPTPRGPNMSEIPPNQHPVPPQRGTNGDGPLQHQTQVGRSLSDPASPAGQQGPSGAHHQVLAVPGMGGVAMTPAMVTSEFNRIPPPSLTKLTQTQDLGMPDKDLTTMTPEEKMQIVALFRRGTMRSPPIPGVGQNPTPTPMRDILPTGPPGAQPWRTPQQQYQTPIGRSMSNLDSPTIQQDPSVAGTATIPQMLTSEIDRIPPPTLAKLKRKLGMAGKDLAIMTPEEKTQLVELSRRGTMTSRNAPGPSTVTLGQQQEPMHPPMHPHGMVVQQRQLRGMHFSGPMAVPSMISQTSSMQHPMNPPAMQPGQGMVNPQIHHYRQAMQNIHNPPNMPRHVMPAAAPSPAAVGEGSHPRVLGLPNSRVDAPPPHHHPASRIGGPGQGVPSATATPAPRTPNVPGLGPGMAAPSTLNFSTLPGPSVPVTTRLNPGPPDLDPTHMYSVHAPEFTPLDPGALMHEDPDFVRDFAAWFYPPSMPEDDTHGHRHRR